MTTEELKLLLDSYAENKSELDKYKKVCDSQNAEIKKAMEEHGVSKFNSDTYIANKQIKESVSFNEQGLLTVLKNAGIPDIIKTKEYVDMDALESALYNGRIPAEVIARMNEYKLVKTTVALTVRRRKD